MAKKDELSIGGILKIESEIFRLMAEYLIKMILNRLRYWRIVARLSREERAAVHAYVFEGKPLRIGHWVIY